LFGSAEDTTFFEGAEMKTTMKIEIETTPKRKFLVDESLPCMEDVTEDVDKKLNGLIYNAIEEIIQNDEFEDNVLFNQEDSKELPTEIEEFCDFGSVKITISNDLKNL